MYFVGCIIEGSAALTFSHDTSGIAVIVRLHQRDRHLEANSGLVMISASCSLLEMRET